MMRILFTIAYQGTAFSGWQSQVQGNTIQDLLEAAALKIAQVPVIFQAAGRTDAGVHALGQCAHADVPDRPQLSASQWLRALNAHLPPSIRILRAKTVPQLFHARFSAVGKTYRYRVWIGKILPPAEVPWVWHVPQYQLDPQLLQMACDAFVGEHDFWAFSANRGRFTHRERFTHDECSTHREPLANRDPAVPLPSVLTRWQTIRRIEWIQFSRRGSCWTLTFRGNGFLYKMVRILTAALIRMAQGRDTLEHVMALLKAGSPSMAQSLQEPLSSGASSALFMRYGQVAPAQGLTLMKVHYR